MPFSSGTFSLTSGNPVVTATTISSTWANNTLSDIATGLSTCVLKDGTQTMTANIPMGGFKMTGLAAGTVAGDSVRYEQVVGAYLPISGGTLTGSLLFTDATYDIGASGATRPRDFFLSRNAVIGGTLNVTGHPTLEGVTATGATGTGKLVYDTSPTLTTAVLGSSTATTQSAGDNSTKVATTAYADTAGKPTLGTPAATTSGTTAGYTGLPSGVRRITIMFSGVSTNGTSNMIVQIGPSGGYETSTYTSRTGNTGAGGAATSTAGFVINGSVSAANTVSGTVVLNLESSSANTWTCMAVLNESTTVIISSGVKSLAGVLDRVRVTMENGTDAFDAGEINIQYQ